MAEDAIQSFLASYDEDQQTQQSHASSIPHERLICCCGNEHCAYLKRNQDALDGLERDVKTAAQLGQALLVRHETYMADAEKERGHMAEHIERLEGDKKELELQNRNVVEENRNLLNQLEAVNNAVASSDTHISNLQAALKSSQQELQKLSILAAKTERLEQQLLEFEREQASWQTSLEQKESEEKSAVRRWQKAERTLSSLQDQLERIEREAREERERHSEVIGRMERRHNVERELDLAAGRLKGAAASKNGGKDGGTVVSHFVKDILQDNANLQMGIVELREMLQSSNDEVETLRKQLSDHQPVPTPRRSSSPEKQQSGKDLRGELTRASSQELHVHHHYHAPTPVPRQRSAVRKPKKKRYGALTPGASPPPSLSSTPRSSISYSGPSPAAAILQQTAVSIPQPVPRRKRWSTQSSQTYASTYSTSTPSSPQSTNRASSLYDRVFSETGYDSSRPTTPADTEPGSPALAPIQYMKPHQVTAFRTKSAPLVAQRKGFSPAPSRPSLNSVVGMSIEDLPHLEHQRTTSYSDVIAEETELEWEMEEDDSRTDPVSDMTSPGSQDAETPLPIQEQDFYSQPRLRRAMSHESLLSVSGMDIHTLRSRPSQMLAPFGGGAFKATAMLSSAHADGRNTSLSRPAGDSRNILSGMAADKRRIASASATASGSTSKPGLGKKVGGWVFGKWGTSPTPTPAPEPSEGREVVEDRRASSMRSGSIKSGSDKSAIVDLEATPRKKTPVPQLRAPGINQSGPIFGLGPEKRLSHPPIMKALDQQALAAVLDEAGS
ncbi:hypothetical protein K431DRAFT_284961 [Polychaeton citri CBS 116435]|uniref:Uncharacterized protein n=1 Tax=Polychaeton citri CBS 116435 TaxID=1314669 RepID=A0A9P4Q8V2_9PEZI|nr:hypothetical protein K431DRAFT_284961 [Polychaeton citri CBS 116435]